MRVMIDTNVLISALLFPSQHWRSSPRPASLLPLVLLKMNEQDKRCPFVTPQGCGIYQERPWACRIFPLDKAERSNQYNVVALPSRCRGLEEEKELMVEEYIKKQ